MTDPSYTIEDLLPPLLVPPEWTENVPCIGRWEEFDGYSKTTARVCWTECKSREQCFLSAMEYEAATNARYRNRGGESYLIDGEIMAAERTGILGGYTPHERELIYLDVVTSDDPAMALYQYL